MHLSNELKLLIITNLAAVSPPSTITAEATTDYDDYEKSLDHLPHIPPHAAISQTLLALSQTNAIFRSLLAPTIYATLTLQNTVASGTAISKIAQGENARFVKRIDYIAAVPLPPYDVLELEEVDNNPSAPKPSDFPESVKHILSHLSLFPNLETVSIHFAAKLLSLQDNISNQDTLEDAEEILTAESREGWRALMTSTYTALAQNTPGVVKSLILRELIMKESSAWETVRWREFLGGLTKFDVSVRGWDNGAGWSISTFECYTDFWDNFDHYFFDHLTEITHLSIAANEDGPAGTGGGYTGPLSFKRHHMPHLHTIVLDYVLVGETVVTLLATHAKTLRSLHLKHAYAPRAWWFADLSWSGFFSSLLATTPLFPNLTSCVIETTLADWEVLAEADAVEKGETTGRAEGLEKELLYIEFSDKYGSICTDADWRKFEPDRAEKKARDWEAYERFLQVVEGNKKVMAGDHVSN